MMEDWIPNFIAEIGPTNAIVLMFAMGIGVVLWVMSINRRLTKKLEDVTYKFNTLNTWAFAADKHIKLNGLKCGNSIGDFMLDWDGVPGRARDAASKVLHGEGRSKAAKTARGSALTQRN